MKSVLKRRTVRGIHNLAVCSAESDRDAQSFAKRAAAETRECAQDEGNEADVCVIELGGTVGDIESMPFIEGLRQLQYRIGTENMFIVQVRARCGVPMFGCVHGCGSARGSERRQEREEHAARSAMLDSVLKQCEAAVL
eukprot:933854-Rhodomonas_salina.3